MVYWYLVVHICTTNLTIALIGRFVKTDGAKECMNQTLTLGLREAAQLTGLSHWTLRQYIRTGRLQAVRIGRRVLLEPAELERLIAAGKSEAKQ